MTVLKKVFTVELTPEEVTTIAEGLSDSCLAKKEKIKELKARLEKGDPDVSTNGIKRLEDEYKNDVQVMKSMGSLVGTTYYGY